MTAMSSFCPSTRFPTSLSPSNPRNFKLRYISPPRRKLTPPISSLKIGVEEISQLIHNKALVAATVATAIGQLAKPLFRGDGITLRSLIQAGGMPSTHSSGVVAVTTSLGLERGFSDSIFGMSVVFAAIVMYDAQGVRREAGNHAKILNRILKAQEEELIDSKPETSFLNSKEKVPLLSHSEKTNSYTENSELRDSKITSGSASLNLKDSKETSKDIYINYSSLNESIGHTEIEVLAGAILGLIVSLAVHTIL